LGRLVEERKLPGRQQFPDRVEEAFGRDFLVGLADVVNL
jgi:hypothetical protein